jgi:hypothetical protein
VLEEEAIEVERRGGDSVGDGVDSGRAVGLPLALAPSVIGRCLGFVRHCVGTMNVGSCAPSVPPFIWRCKRRGHCHKNDRRPGSGRVMKIFHNREITFLTP